ncbi:MAG TPA: hypothetical protein VLB07_09560 [Woeseiaceae bacterium]|nr:hypothetical protein [Woeseiaceae bacterium]
MRNAKLMAACVLCMSLGGCAATQYDVAGASAPLEIRSVQTREYDALDKPMTMRAVIATLQDLGFTIDQADLGLGIVTGTRMLVSDMRMTVSVAPKADNRVSVRANARVGETSITQAEVYQDFFVVLDKAMFLTRNNVD